MPKPLSELHTGESALVRTLHPEPAMRRRLGDLGLTAGTRVECVQQSLWGDPTAYLIRGAVIALRADDAVQVLVD